MASTPSSPSYITRPMMSSASTTLEQPMFIGDSPSESEDSSRQAFSALVVPYGLEGTPQSFEEGCTLDANKTLSTHSFSPLTLSLQGICRGSSADTAMSLTPLPPSPSTENSTKDNDCKVTTPSMVSSEPTPNLGFTGVAALPETVVEHPPVSRILSPLLPPDGSQGSQGYLPGVAPVDFSFSGASPGAPRASLLPTALGCPSCLATNPTLETETGASIDISDNAELFATRHVACPEQKLPSGLTTTFPSPDPSNVTVLSSVDSDAQLTPREISLREPIRSQACAAVPILGPTPLALLTPLRLVDTFAREASPSHPVRDSGVEMHSTPPPSSPRTDCNVTVVGGSSGDEEADCTCNLSEINDYPTRTMSSPNFILHEDESSLSPSPPQQTTTRTKRVQYDEGDEDSTSARSAKRIRMDETMSSPLRKAPAPRRATLASQQLSRRKLAAPFRSPLQIKPISTQPITLNPLGDAPQEQVAGEPRARYRTISDNAQGVPTGVQATIRSFVRSSKAAAQFRSPLVMVPVHASRPIVLPNQSIMNLERKLTILRRAIKIKRDGDEGHLERLARKWRDAGREAAYELWSIVRDLSTEGCEIRGTGNDNGWGWEGHGERGTVGEDGLDAEEGGYAEKRQESTLGVMLRKLGIAPETLGWNDEEETFVGE